MSVVRPTRQKLSLLALSLSLSLGMVLSPDASAQVQEQKQALAPPANATEAALRNLYNTEWDWRQKEFAREKIDGRWQSAAHLPSVTAQTWQRRADYWAKVIKELDAIPATQLSREEKINEAVFRTTVEGLYNGAIWKTYEAPFNSDTFFWAGLNPRQPYQDAADWQRLIGRLNDIPRYFSENITNMDAGLTRGWSVPRTSVQGRDNTIVPYTKTDAENPYLAMFDRIPTSIPEPTRSQLREQGRKAVLEKVVPAYSELLTFMREQYLTRARTTTGASDLPNGREFYKTQIREFVTRDMTAKQVHDIGLAEVARINAEMKQVMAKSGFKGSFEEFLQFLRTDPQFYAKTPQELLSYTAWIAKKVDGELKHVVGTLPRYRFTILPVPDEVAPIYTSGRGGLDSCLFNTYDLPSRPLYNLPALVVHECAPGHSFQAALALEAPARPDFRQQTYFSGYGEGWGLYTEWLGTLMGVYETPYDDFGRLTFEMWRAARLVIDTGLHEYGWTRQQAIDYLAANTALAHHDIVTEIDRYIAWPGQATAYYLGYKTMRDLRSEAEKELGPKFDQRPFHDTILNLGSVPLPVLESEVRLFVAERKAGTRGTAAEE